MADSISKAFNRARSRGLAEAASSVWGQARGALASDSHLKLMVRPAGGELPDRADLVFKEAGPGDAASYAADIGTDSETTFRRRLTETTSCYLVSDASLLLHASWVTTGAAWTSELRSYITPPAGDAYVYESFTRAEARGRGIYPFALHGICAALAARSIDRVWVGVEADNAPSIRAITKAGFAEAFEIRFARRGLRVSIDEPHGPLAADAPKLIPALLRA